MTKICNNCAWYCHSNSMCYGNELLLTGIEIGLPIDKNHNACESWAYDGLEQWEREACEPETLMTMEENGVRI